MGHTEIPARITFTCDSCGRYETVDAPALRLADAGAFLPEHWRIVRIVNPHAVMPAELAMELCPRCVELARLALRAVAPQTG